MRVRTRVVTSLAITLVIAIGLLVSSSLGLPQVSVRFPDGHEQPANLPFQVNQTGMLTYKISLPGFVSDGPLSWLPGARLYRVIPDDLLVAMRLNGENLSLAGVPPGGLQDYRNGFVMDLGELIDHRADRGTVPVLEVDVVNGGGVGGLSVIHSWRSSVEILVWFGLGLLLFVALAGSGLSWKRGARERTLALWGIAVAGLALRLALSSGLTGDYVSFLQPWYDTIHTQGFAAYGTNFANYAPLYLYLMGIGTMLPLSPIITIKLISVLGEMLLAIGAWKLMSVMRPSTDGAERRQSWLPAIAFGLVFFLPTALINGAFWGQCDGLYMSAIVWAIVFAVQKRSVAAMIWWGIAISFKLQAAFIGPLFIALMWTKWLRWPWIFLAFAPYVLFTVPSLVAGRPFADLMTIYLNQADTYMKLSMNAPSMHNWFSDGSFAAFNAFGLGLAAVSALAVVWYGGRPMLRRAWDPDRILAIALVVSVALPFFMPRMHERYFFAADVLSVLWAIRRPKDWAISVAIVAASFFSYLPFLFGAEPIPFPILSIVMGIGCGLAIRRLVLLNRPARVLARPRLSYLRGRRSL